MAKYSDEQTQAIKNFIASYGEDAVIPRDDFYQLMSDLGNEFSEKSLTAKIRFLGGKVERKTKEERVKVFSDEDEAIILEMTSDPDNLPYVEDIAERLGKEVKQVRGKLVSMRIKGVKTKNMKPKPLKLFTEEETSIIEDMIKDIENLPFVEDIAERLGKEVKQVRGKLASMKIKGIQSKNKKAAPKKIYTDELKEELKELIKTNSVEEIAKMKDLNITGLRSILGKMNLLPKKAKSVYWTEERVNQLQSLLDEGRDVKEIAKIMEKNSLVIAKKVKQLRAAA